MSIFEFPPIAPSLPRTWDDSDSESELDHDDNQIIRTTTDIDLSSISAPLRCEVLVVSVGDSACALLDYFFSDGQKIGEISTGCDIKRFGSIVRSAVVLKRYGTDGTILSLASKLRISDQHSFEFTQFVFQKIIQAKKVIVLDSVDRGEPFIGDYAGKSARFVQSKTWPRDITAAGNGCTELSAPDIISGASASILSHCHIRNESALAIICEGSDTETDVYAMAYALARLVNKIDALKGIAKGNSDEFVQGVVSDVLARVARPLANSNIFC
eukprot:TRINITY_DN12425_c0_g1_i1.p1 TRINITY_DN12425_c0_g1~~TRINITY_DN12425_c0_g1_i1.p1  ORF type:complete len:280 (-),score=60.92 TRINITY_DN12425_c0_g1_i1:37-849(-)